MTESDDVLGSILRSLSELEAQAPGTSHSGLAVSRHLHDQRGESVHWRTVDARLQANRKLASRRRRQGRWEYRLLEEGRRQLGQGSDAVMLVDPGNALQAVLGLHDLLGKLAGSVAVCDPYLDEVTLEHLGATPKTSAIRLLTMNVRDSGPLRRVLSAASTGGHQIEIRVVSKRVLHDRYVVDDKGLLILGTSLNGFGKKQSFVVRAGEDIRATVLAEFERLWALATPWP